MAAAAAAFVAVAVAVAVVALAEAKTLTSLWPRSLSLLADIPLYLLPCPWLTQHAAIDSAMVRGPCRDSGRSLLLDASFTFAARQRSRRVGSGARGAGRWSVVARDPHGMVNLRCQSLKLLRSIFVIRLTSILFSYLTLP